MATPSVPSPLVIEVPFEIAWPFGQSGPLAAFTNYYDDRDLYLADLSSGALDKVAKASEREVMDVALSGDEIVWVDGRYDGYKDLVPCGNQGGIDWRVRLTNVANGQTSELESGRQKDVAGYCTADSPRVAIDGNLVAYAAEHATANKPHGWQIVLFDLDTGETIRTIQTNYGVFGLQIDHGDAAYIEGSYARGGDFDPTHTWLMLSRAADADPVRVTSDSDDVSLADGRLAWTTCDDTSCRTMSSLSATVDATVIGDSSYPGPIAMSDSVIFAVDHQPYLWVASSNSTSSISAVQDPRILRATDGWIVWTGDQERNGELVQTLAGLPTSEIPGLGSQ